MESSEDGDVFAVSRACLSIGALDMLSGTQLHHRFAPHMHDSYAIGLIDAGQSHVRYRGVVSTSTAAETTPVPPHASVTVKTTT